MLVMDGVCVCVTGGGGVLVCATSVDLMEL